MSVDLIEGGSRGLIRQMRYGFDEITNKIEERIPEAEMVAESLAAKVSHKTEADRELSMAMGKGGSGKKSMEGIAVDQVDVITKDLQ